ncbi:hypothetical protein ACFL6S_35205, partial [Candidatus Poribacteria bacterium]
NSGFAALAEKTIQTQRRVTATTVAIPVCLNTETFLHELNAIDCAYMTRVHEAKEILRSSFLDRLFYVDIKKDLM